jgi:hypothetical protein
MTFSRTVALHKNSIPFATGPSRSEAPKRCSALVKASFLTTSHAVYGRIGRLSCPQKAKSPTANRALLCVSGCRWVRPSLKRKVTRPCLKVNPKNDMIILTDEQIQELISEQKPLPDGLVPSPKMTTRNQSLRRDIEVTSDAGHEFII